MMQCLHLDILNIHVDCTSLVQLLLELPAQGRVNVVQLKRTSQLTHLGMPVCQKDTID